MEAKWTHTLVKASRTMSLAQSYPRVCSPDGPTADSPSSWPAPSELSSPSRASCGRASAAESCGSGAQSPACIIVVGIGWCCVRCSRVCEGYEVAARAGNNPTGKILNRDFLPFADGGGHVRTRLRFVQQSASADESECVAERHTSAPYFVFHGNDFACDRAVRACLARVVLLQRLYIVFPNLVRF